MFCFWLISVENMFWFVSMHFLPPTPTPTVFASACLCYVKGCVWQRGSEGLLMMWDKKNTKKTTTSEAEVIESGERNNSDLRRELGRLFVLLSNSLRNLHGGWQLYAAWKGLRLYLSTQWGIWGFPSGLWSICVLLTHSLAHLIILIEP